MKNLLKWLLPLALIAVAIMILRKTLGEQKAIDLSGTENKGPSEAEALNEAALGGEISPDLLKILVCPLDRGPLTLSADGKWLINPRNGYRYPIRDGIPIMLIDEGRKFQDTSLITQPA